MDTGLYSSTGSTDAQQKLASFWNTVNEEINTVDFKTQELPLARIKKIMKMDEEVKMISAEAPVLFAKAAEIFINELSLRAWIHTEDNKRRTLQRNDIAMAVAKYDQFDFLIDIVPRDELKPQKRQELTQEVRNPNADQVQYYFQLANPTTSTTTSTTSNLQSSSNNPQQQHTSQQSSQNSQPIVIGNQASGLNLSSSNTLQIQPTQVMQSVGLQPGSVSQSNSLSQSSSSSNKHTTESSSSQQQAQQQAQQQQQQQLYNMTTLRFNSQLPNYNRSSLDSNQYQYSQQLSYLQPQVYNSNQTSYQGNQQSRSGNQD